MILLSIIMTSRTKIPDTPSAGEENAWFRCQHIGSRIALGLFDPRLLDEATRYDTDVPLGLYMSKAGLDLAPIRARQISIRRDIARCFIELHIEQGPILVERAFPIGVVAGIRGSLRHRSSICRGEYGHAGTVPRESRRDAMVAVADLIMRMDQSWAERLA